MDTKDVSALVATVEKAELAARGLQVLAARLVTKGFTIARVAARAPKLKDALKDVLPKDCESSMACLPQTL